jgi:hypothetical protein
MSGLRPIVLLTMACCLLTPSGSRRTFAEPPSLLLVGAITAITEPMTSQVVQRRDDNIGNILIVGRYSGNVSGFQASSTLQPGMRGTPLNWAPLIDLTIFEGYFVGVFRQPAGGFYNIQIQPTFEGQVGVPVTIQGVGVGEVFITAGQSNTTNFGSPTGFYPNVLVSCFNDGTGRGLDPTYPGAFWRWGYDPQPAIDQSPWGSVWPTMGSNLTEALGVPIGFYAAGCGGTAIEEWLPGYVRPANSVTPEMVLFNRLTNAISYLTFRGGVRGVLWHQGETDYYDQTSGLTYGANLRYIINASRAVTGVPIKWMVAQASSPLTDNLSERIGLEVAQAQVVDNFLTFPGPNADFIGLPYRIYLDNEPVHFNVVGLNLLGSYWGLYVANIPGFLDVGVLPPP